MYTASQGYRQEKNRPSVRLFHLYIGRARKSPPMNPRCETCVAVPLAVGHKPPPAHLKRGPPQPVQGTGGWCGALVGWARQISKHAQPVMLGIERAEDRDAMRIRGDWTFRIVVLIRFLFGHVMPCVVVFVARLPALHPAPLYVEAMPSRGVRLGRALKSRRIIDNRLTKPLIKIYYPQHRAITYCTCTPAEKKTQGGRGRGAYCVRFALKRRRRHQQW